jgi:hypothetical protein
MGDFSWEPVIGTVGLILGTTLFAFSRDRFPRVARTLSALGLVVMLAGFGLLVWAEPRISLLLGGLFVVVNFLLPWIEASARWKASPAENRDIGGWASTVHLLTSMGWVFTDAWVLDLGQVRPPFLSFERYPDGTKLNGVGRHERGGVITIETFLDDRQGMLVTVRKRSSHLRPPWMFRQVLDVPLEDLVRAHDDALFRLSVEGILPAPPFPGSGLDAERYGSRMVRADISRRWYLWVLRPIVARLTSTRRPLAEQEDFDRQVERYKTTLARSALQL